MTPREERLLRIEERSEVRRKRRRVLSLIAAGFGRDAEAWRYSRLAWQADMTARKAWQARIEAGTARWAADDANRRLVLVKS